MNGLQRDVVLVFGSTGSGKTTKAKEITQEYPRALIIEAGFAEFPAQQFSDYLAMVDYLQNCQCFSNFQNLDSPKFSHACFRVAYTPTTAEHSLVFSTAIELGNCCLILDEADRFDDPRYFEEYDNVITRGRHFGISIVACGLHIFKLPKELRRQATKVYAFRQTDPSDIEALSEIIGPLAYKVGPDEEGRPQLADFSYVEWDRKTGSRIVGDGNAVLPTGSMLGSPSDNQGNKKPLTKTETPARMEQSDNPPANPPMPQ